ncbi:MAG: hypothetical protein SO016_06245 [Lachnospiraceae bacterium]|nr:hypothetical protein [Robinsoniella sp.]MDY3766286.1 hypothetical protein [Lachnospiraceae bacterium]
MTAEVEIEQGGLNSIPGNVIYLDGSWNTDEDTSKKQLLNGNLEGMSMDDNTFIGVLKMDQPEEKRHRQWRSRAGNSVS